MQATERESMLVIDTCAERGSLALFRGETLCGETVLQERTASASFVRAIEQLLGSANIALERLSGLGIVSGPGSFTGLRIGLSVVKGLSEAASLRVTAASRLAVLCDAGNLREGFSVLRAGREEMYVREERRDRAPREMLIGVEAFRALTAGEQVVYTEDTLKPALTEAGTVIHVDLSARHAHRILRGGLEQGGVDVATLDANYVRDEQAIYRKQQVSR